MITLQINKIYPIKTGCSYKYEGIANDNCNFYLSVPELREIHKYDLCLKNKEVIQTCKGYRSICYDEKDNCFWAIASKSSNKIFKLDLCLKEKNHITVHDKEMSFVTLTGVSCIGKSDKLLISFNGGIGEIDKYTESDICMLQKSPATCFSSVEALDKYYVASKIRNCNFSVSIYSYCNELKLQCCLPDEYCIEDMTHICYEYKKCKARSTFYILATKARMYSYLFKCIIEYSCDDTCECIEEFLQCDENTDCGKNINDVIESIALVEAALSHILNAEGQKIEKTICTSKDPCEIIRVNDSVNKTIINITHLEQILFSKLQLAQEMCNEILKE